MAKAIEIEVVIGADGTVSLDVGGAEGKRCLDLTKPFEDALGVVSKRDLKASYYQTQSATQSVKK